MAAPAQPSEAPSAPAPGAAAITTKTPKPARKLGVRAVLSLPQTYASFIAKNESQVSQIESALRSLTYIIPGRFRDAEIASEAIHSGVQLLSMYHDSLLERAAADTSSSPSSPSTKTTKAPSPSRTIHARYTTFWSQKSPLYRRVARALQIVQYTQLLVEMAARRRGDDRLRWRLVVLVEAFKALCKLILLRITRGRPLLTPALPERQPIPPPDDDGDESKAGEYVIPPELRDDNDDDDDAAHKATAANGHANGAATAAHSKEWHMPRTHSVLPSLPDSADINSYLLSRVLTADDIKPAPKLLRPLAGAAQAAEVLHILAPLAYAMALAHFSLRGSSSAAGKNRSGRAAAAATWAPWALGLALSVAARQLRDRGLRATALEREEWSRRGWGLGWWAMRGAAYEGVVKGVIGGVKRRLPGFVGGILDDYEYLWETYYFSTAD
ncbi:hypothetical protein RB595_010675 [Gaeumannomyces hyphopodioides]